MAISEILVRETWKRQGIARVLHDEFLAGRPEERATLLVRPRNVAAERAYWKWGWVTVGTLDPGWENAPTYNSLILPKLKER
ncbi:hypothetical protein [Allonocardiopsis opalescens]|uniref:hypothetical protein n=1 Tax=Allonocardiopsis opalescens TaxID=1144618 RepID=UPI0011B246D3|nr:hypothetical protein [Allonocardiopsis opalescens]